MDLLIDEKIEDLQENNLKLIQNKEKYCFTSDAVLLSRFANVKSKDIMLDICSGSGVIPILINGRIKNPIKTYCVEVDEYFSSLILRNARLNNFNFNVYNSKIQDCTKELSSLGINIVTVNPPYEKITTAKVVKNAIARQEILLDLETLCSNIGEILQTGGKMFIIHKANRLAEIIYQMQKNLITPKKIQFIKSKVHNKPHLVMIEGLKNGGQQVDILDDIILN